jgi:glycosyltransferase involved in cell wall biosynthesis
MRSERGAILMLTPDQDFLDRRIAQEANTLAAHGWSVDIFATHGSLHSPAETFSQNVRLLPRPAQPRASLARGFKHLLRDRAPRLHRVADAAQALITDRAAQTADWSIDHLLLSGPYDAVFAHDIPVLPLAIQLKERWSCAVICDLHEIYAEMDTTASAASTRGYWRRIESEFLERADGILCVNDAVEQHVRHLGGPEVPIAVVQNSVPFVEDPRRSDCDIKAIYAIPESRRVLAFAGRLESDTNVEALVAGFGEARLDGWALALLGTGAIQERLSAYVADRALQEHVFLGVRVPQHELVPTLASANAAALPYRAVDRNHEIATPNKLFEYAQARLPIGASKLPMIERIITVNGNGAFVDFSSPATAAATLRRFLETDLPMISGNDLETAARNLSWENEEPALMSVFTSALAGAAGGGPTNARSSGN